MVAFAFHPGSKFKAMGIRRVSITECSGIERIDIAAFRRRLSQNGEQLAGSGRASSTVPALRTRTIR
uniref:hypothetical protein n=1 Tax=Rhizobium/Agrobacterium group TaxID=227290 RepID=UPI00155DD571|nr:MULTISPECIES: hypothetical protein [Rhizobium/Agrobacterium group]